MPEIPLHLKQFARYCIIGASNFLLNAAIFNGCMYATGTSTGDWVTVFALISFVIVTTISFFPNMLWTFRETRPKDRKRQYVQFFCVAGASALVSIALIHVLVSVVGAPSGIATTYWANFALLLTIIISVLGNFFGYKFFVFAN